jgi:hypothetical protein
MSRKKARALIADARTEIDGLNETREQRAILKLAEAVEALCEE